VQLVRLVLEELDAFHVGQRAVHRAEASDEEQPHDDGALNGHHARKARHIECEDDKIANPVVALLPRFGFLFRAKAGSTLHTSQGFQQI
jgi:hypothetical protein